MPKTESYNALFIKDIPEGTHFGLDCYSWQAGEKFKGIKLIPEGIHFIFYSSSKNSITTGFFIEIGTKDVIIKQWNKEKEILVKLDEEEEHRYSLGVQNFDFDQHLGAYQMEFVDSWTKLSSFLTKKILDKLDPASHNIFSNTGPMTKKEQEILNKDYKEKEKWKTELQDKEKKNNVHFSKIETTVECKTAAEITETNFDKTRIFESTLNLHFNNETTDFLGELQYAFIIFFLGICFDGFEQWKRMVVLVCSCDKAVSKYQKFYENFLDVFLFQLQEVPDDFFTVDLAEGNFLEPLLKDFFEILENRADSSEKLQYKKEEFQKLVEKKFDCNFSVQDFEDYDEEDGPVIVNL